MLNKELNPSRKSRALKIIDDINFTMPVNKEFISKQIRVKINELVWGHRYERKMSTLKNLKKIEDILKKEDVYPDDYVFSSKTITDWDFFTDSSNNATELSKQKFFKNVKFLYEHVRVNWSEFKELRPEERELKLETLPKSYSDYILNSIIRNEINYYLSHYTFAGQICNFIAKFNINIEFFMSDSNQYQNEKSEHDEAEALFAMYFCREILQRYHGETSSMQQDFEKEIGTLTVESVIYHAYMSFLNKDTLKISPEEYDVFKDLWRKTYKNVFYEILKYYFKRYSSLFSMTEREFQYKSIKDAVRDYYRNARYYSNESKTISMSGSSASFLYLGKEYKNKHGVNFTLEFERRTIGHTFTSPKSYNLTDIKNTLIHFSEMVGIIPELKKYDLSTKLDFNHHQYNMTKIELLDVVNESKDHLKHIEKSIEKLHSERPQNYLARIDNLDTIKTNISRGVKNTLKEIDESDKVIIELEANGNFNRNYRLLDRAFQYHSSILNWIEKIGHAKKIERDSLDWGVSVLEFNSAYKPFIKYKEGVELKKGFFWEKLPFGYSQKESVTMGHCGNAGRDDEDVIYSLRRRYPNNKYSVHVTLTVNKTLGVTIECKGRGNASPIESYWPYLIELFIKDDLITCAESGLGHNPDADFNINMSLDAFNNKEKIIAVKPYLFSKSDLVLKKYGKEKLDDMEKGLTATQIFERFCLSKENKTESGDFTYTNYFAFGKQNPQNQGYIPSEIEKNPHIMKSKNYLKTKEILTSELISSLLNDKLIEETTFFSEDKTYKIKFTFNKSKLESYSGRDFFDNLADQVAESENPNFKISILNQINIDFGDFTFQNEQGLEILRNYIKEEFSDGFQLSMFERKQSKDKPLSSSHDEITITENIDYHILTRVFAKEFRKYTWLSVYVLDEGFYENDDVNVSDLSMESIFLNQKMKNKLDKISPYANQIIELVFNNKDIDEIDSKYLELRDATKNVIRNFNEQDCQSQIYSHFHDIVFEFIDYDKKTGLYSIVWDNLLKYMYEHAEDHSEFDIINYNEFFNLVKSFLVQLYPYPDDNKSKNKKEIRKKYFEKFINIAEANSLTSKKTNFVRYNSVLVFIINFLENLDWDSASDFEPSEYDFDVTDGDKINDFFEQLNDQLESIDFTEDFLKHLKKLGAK